MKKHTNKKFQKTKSSQKSGSKGGAGSSQQGQKPSRSAKRSAREAGKEPRRDQGSKLRGASLYGLHAVREAFLNEERNVETLYCTSAGLSSFEDIMRQAQSLGLKRPTATMVEKEQLEKTLPPGAVHQGLALACGALPEKNLEDLLIKYRDEEQSLLVILDQVTDPHNVGAILRSACAFGARGMIMQSKHAPDLGGVLAKTACGAVEHVDVAYETNLSRAIEDLQAAGYFVYGLDERGKDITSVSLPPKAVVVMGAEGPGMRRLVKEHCDELLCLPMHGPMRSINVSNAAAVTLHEFANRRSR